MGDSATFKNIMKSLRLKQQEVADKLKISRAKVSLFYTKERLTEDWKLKIISTFELENNIFKSRVNKLSDTDLQFEAGESNFYEVRNKIKTKEVEMNLPYKSMPVFPSSDSTILTEVYKDLRYKTEGFICVPVYEDCDFATYTYGHSMYPVIESGCLIVCRKTQGKQMILWGEIYYTGL